MKILHLRSSNFYGGPERQIHAHAIQVLSHNSTLDGSDIPHGKNVSIIVASFSENGRTPDFIHRMTEDRIHTHVFRVTSSYDSDVLNRLRSFLLNNSIDIICTHDYRSHIIAAIATMLQPAKWIAFSRGKTRENFKTTLFQSVASMALIFSDRVVGVSNSEALRLRRSFVRKKKIEVVPNAILDIQRSGFNSCDLRKRFSFAEEDVIVLAAGRFSAEKGQRYLVEAASKILEIDPRFKFVLFGEGPELMRIKLQVKKLDLEDIVHCPGFEPNLAGCLDSADIIVNPSISEAMPNIILESIAQNKIIVGTSVGGVPDIITDGGNGILVKKRNSDALASAILEAGSWLGRENSRLKRINRGLASEMSAEKQMGRLISIYQSVIDG